MRITLVVDNAVHATDEQLAQKRGLIGETGFSALIEDVGGTKTRVLFDCGRRGEVVLNNLRLLDIPLATIDHVVLSHGSPGHIGGFRAIAGGLKAEATVVMHPTLELWQQQDGPALNVSSLVAEVGQSLSVRSHADPVQVADGILISGSIHRSDGTIRGHHGEVSHDPQVTIRAEEREEIALGIRTRKGFLVLVACRHNEPLLLVRHFQHLFKGERFFGLIGGFHLWDDEEKARTFTEELKELSPELIAPCHSVQLSAGMIALARQEAFQPFSTGDTIVVE